jgi:hypothetical protein
MLCCTVRKIIAAACVIAVFRAPASAAQSPSVIARGGPAPVAVITLDP